jgi:predicted Zn-dependent protease
VFAAKGDRQQAITDLETVVALQPRNSTVYTELAELYSKIGDPQKASIILAKQKEIKDATGTDDRDDFLSRLADPLL